MRYRGTAALLVVLAVGCLDSRGPAGPSLSGDDELVLQILPNLDWRTLPDDHAVITAASVEGLTLHLRLRYGGGCASHEFALVAGTSFAESNPPFTLLRLAHDGNGDMCDALLQSDLEVDLSPIAALLQQGGTRALRFELVEPGEQRSQVGELLVAF